MCEAKLTLHLVIIQHLRLNNSLRQVLQRGSEDAIMAGDTLLGRKSQTVRLAPSSNPDVSKCQGSWLADGLPGAQEPSVSTSSQDDPRRCTEQQQWDLVALKVLLADDRPGCDNGTDIYRPFLHLKQIFEEL